MLLRWNGLNRLFIILTKQVFGVADYQLNKPYGSLFGWVYNATSQSRKYAAL
jgi:hypothetical protein